MPQCRGPTREFKLDRRSRDPDAVYLANKRMVLCARRTRMYSFIQFKTSVMFSSVTNLDVWCMSCLVSLRSLQSNTLGRWSFA